jgi:predicted Fe-Mo cluster-binding NifX family protein
MKKTMPVFIFLFIFICSGLIFLGAHEDKQIKIAIASDGESIDSQVAEKAARCQWFLFFDEEGKLAEAVENPFREDKGGAGINCANFLAEKEVTLFVAGYVGNKMAGALEDNQITFISFTGTVKDAIAHVLENTTGKFL